MILKNNRIVTLCEEAADVANALDQVPAFALDLETTGLDFHKANIHGIALATDDREWYVCQGAAKAVLPALYDLLKKKTVIMHNGLFDCHFLRRYGIEAEHLVDTMVGQYLVDENQRLGLKTLAHAKMGIEEELPDFGSLLKEAKRRTRAKKKENLTVYDVPLNTLAEYAARDARLTFDLWKITAHELEVEGMTANFFNTEMPFVRVLLDMEEAGFHIDQPALHKLGLEFEQKRAEAAAGWERITGGVNPASPAQLSRYFYEVLGHKATKYTDNGAVSTDIMALTRLLARDKNGAVAALLALRKYEKLIGTYIIPFQEDLWNGRLYGRFNQTGTVTGRLSSSSPCLQNIPAHGELGGQVRCMFGVPQGCDFLDIDYSQMELRITAHYSKDKGMLQVFAEDGDPHQLTADRCKVPRQVAKTLNFAQLYGSGPRTLADTVEKNTKQRPSVKETTDWLARFDQAYPTITNWKHNVIRYARELGYVKTISGRKRRLPEIRSGDQGLRAAAERQAVNAIIQGSVGDVMKWAMLQIHPALKQYRALMTSQVHDELTFECPQEVTGEFGAWAAGVMVSAQEHFGLRVKLKADPGRGPNWAEAKH